MEPIKTIAGKILLYFYSLQRTDYTKLHHATLEFFMKYVEPRKKPSLKWMRRGNDLENGLAKISHNDHNIYNALRYLHDSGFIEMSNSPDTARAIFLNFRVSNAGVDIIESIERGSEEKRKFNIIFNIKLADNINIDSLLKAEIGSLLKVSVI